MTDEELALHGIGITHHFCDHQYAKEARMAAGKYLVQHEHKDDHFSFLGAGHVIVFADGVPTQYKAPALIVIKAGVQHSVTAITDALWYCVHSTDEKDPKTVDAALIAKP